MPATTTPAVELALPPVPPATPPGGPLDRLLARLPADVRASLTDVQLHALAVAAVQPKTDHLIDRRISVRWLRRRYYVRVLAGHERRSLSRLERERQINLVPTLTFFAAVTWLLVSTALFLALALAYFVKSAFGFDVLDGESFLHACFFG